MKTRVFISKNASDCESLVHFCIQNSIELIAQSLIEFEAVPFEIESNYDIAFFSSIRSGQFFFKNELQKSNVVYACIGQTTNSKLKKLGIECEFVGEEAGNPQKIAAEFKSWVKNRTVIFPQSNLSLRTFSSILPENQVINKIVYKTNLIERKIENCQIYIFTSPSNLDAFLIINEIIEDSKVIVWGNSTFEKAKSKGLKVDFVLTKSSLDELIQILTQIC
jgi:uroporphyrinogen-III synthase